MTKEDQIAICRAIAQSCMWGHPGIAGVIIDRLENSCPQADSWVEVYKSNKRQSEYDAVGVVTDEPSVQRYIKNGYRLTNYSPGELAIFHPCKGGGLFKYIIGPLADKYGEKYDSWNFKVYESRALETAR